MRKAIGVLLLAAFTITGCSNMKPQDFADTAPRFVIEDYFSGQTKAWGLFEDRFGNVRRQFTVDINGEWDGRELILEEDFVYMDGERDQRTWRIVKTDANSYQGRAADVVGTASGHAAGNALNWRYELDLKVGDGTWRVKFDDWMFLQPGGVVINRARVSKWGIDIGEVTLFFRKDGEGINGSRPDA